MVGGCGGGEEEEGEGVGGEGWGRGGLSVGWLVRGRGYACRGLEHRSTGCLNEDHWMRGCRILWIRRLGISPRNRSGCLNISAREEATTVWKQEESAKQGGKNHIESYLRVC